MAQKNNQLQELSEEIKRYSQEIAKNLAIHTREEFFNEANKAITKFYSHYEPISYRRHQPIGANIRKSFRKYYSNPHNSIYSGGIEISPEWMDDIYRADTDYIFNLIYAGYHGSVWTFPFKVSNVPPVMEPGPLNIILDKRDSLIKNMPKIANKIAVETRRSGSYKYIE